MSVVNVQALAEVLLRNGGVRVVKNLSTRAIVFNTLSYSVGQFAARIDPSEEDIYLAAMISIDSSTEIGRTY
jgi:hypothetical protein